MAEKNNPVGGEATTNTTHVISGSSVPTGVADSITTSGEDTPSSMVASPVTEPVAGLLPYPHNSLAGINTEASAFRDLIKEVYAEHEKELDSNKGNMYEPNAEMLAAREDSQIRLASELQASLKAQRTMSQKGGQEKGGIKIKLLRDHLHGGLGYKAGDIISVDESSANFIVAAKAGTKVEN